MLKEPVMLKGKSNNSSLCNNTNTQGPFMLKHSDSLFKESSKNKTTNGFYHKGSSESNEQ
jgi:hypothetical protein